MPAAPIPMCLHALTPAAPTASRPPPCVQALPPPWAAREAWERNVAALKALLKSFMSDGEPPDAATGALQIRMLSTAASSEAAWLRLLTAATKG